MPATTSPEVQRFLERLDGVRADGSGWSARCPCRDDDQNPSLHVGEGKDGRVLVTCHRGGEACDFEQICAAVDLEPQDMFPEDSDDWHEADRRRREREQRQPRPPKAAKPKAPAAPPPQLTIVEIYDYTDADGELLFQKVRYVDDTGRKTFRQRRPDPTARGGFTFNLNGVPKVLYRMPDIARVRRNGGYVWVVEGEKDADRVRSLGEVATTMPGGAGKWLPEHTAALAGLNVTVCADNDSVGLSHANFVVEQLVAAGCNVTALQPPAPHKDVSDLLDAGGELYDLVDMTRFRPELPDPDLDEPVEEDQLPEGVEPSKFEQLVGAIRAIADNQRLTDNQRFMRARSLIDSMQVDVVPSAGRLVSWVDFIAETTADDYDWLIPGLLERGERVMVVAAEGVGKTMLARQVAIASACGLHPFTRQQIPKVRTLTVDLENPDKIIRRKSRNILRVATAMVRNAMPMSADLLIKPDGLNLLNPAHRVALEQVIEQSKPELLVMGPMYKAFIDPGGRSAEAVTIEVVMYLDYLRKEYNLALWLEHHAPLGNALSGRELRPFGSAVWSRWPEFGIAISPDVTASEKYVYDVNTFRGSRDSRHWPTKMKRGSVDDLPFHILEYQTD